MKAKSIVAIVLTAGIAAVAAVGSSIASAAESSRPTARHAQTQYNIDKPRDVFTQGARWTVPSDQPSHLLRTGQDLTGVSATPGSTRA